VEGTETCDDENTDNGDGCSALCAVESSYTCDITVEPTTCTANREDTHGAAAGNAARNEFHQSMEVGNTPSPETSHGVGNNNATDQAVGGTTSFIEDTGASDNTPEQSAPTVLFDQPSQGGGKLPSHFGTIHSEALQNGAPVTPAGFVNIVQKLETGTMEDGTHQTATQTKGILLSKTPPTRAEAIEILLNSLNIPVTPGPMPFLDVTQNTQHAAAIATASRLGLLHGDQNPNGSSRGTVRPNDPVNWSELTIILARMKRKGLLKSFPNL